MDAEKSSVTNLDSPVSAPSPLSVDTRIASGSSGPSSAPPSAAADFTDPEEKTSRLMKALSTVGTFNTFANLDTRPKEASEVTSFGGDADTDIEELVNDIHKTRIGSSTSPSASSTSQLSDEDPIVAALRPLADEVGCGSLEEVSQVEANVMALMRLQQREVIEQRAQQYQQQFPIEQQFQMQGNGANYPVINMGMMQMQGPSGDSRVLSTSMNRSARYSPGPTFGGSHLRTLNTVSKFGQLGSGTGSFNSPHGFCVGPMGEIIVADTLNHRLQVLLLLLCSYFLTELGLKCTFCP